MHAMQSCEEAVWLAGDQILLGLGACAPAGWALLVTPDCFPRSSIPTRPSDRAERVARVIDCDHSIYLCSQLTS